MFSSLLLILAQASALLLAAWLVAAVLRSASAAARHFVWLTAFAALLLLPAALLPPPLVRVAPAPALAPVLAAGRTVVQVTAGNPNTRRPLAPALFALWAAGAALLAARQAWFQRQAARLARAARPWRSVAGIPVRLSESLSIPIVCGLRRPVILLPAEAPAWPPERLSVVLCHEASHAARRDPLSQFAASLACSLYWPLPWVWSAARRLSVEAELACDDLVLSAGPRPSDYASHLLDIVRTLEFQNPIPKGGIPMARLSDLEHRLRAMLRPNCNRLPAGRRFMFAVAAAALALFIPLTALRAPLFAFGDGLSGVVRDASGAVVPRARVTIEFTGDSRREVVWTGPAGEFTAAPLPDGDYTLTIEKPGFALLRLSTVPVGAGHPGRLELTLQTGSVRETVNVVGEGTPAVKPAPAPSGSPTRIRVGGHVQATKLLEKARPVYPTECKAEGVQGTVLLRAVIGKEGAILNLEPLNKLVDARLVQSALDAVGKWKYQPTLLNGQPVEVMTVIEVNYTLMP